jgi:hypothetical protein
MGFEDAAMMEKLFVIWVMNWGMLSFKLYKYWYFLTYHLLLSRTKPVRAEELFSYAQSSPIAEMNDNYSVKTYQTYTTDSYVLYLLVAHVWHRCRNNTRQNNARCPQYLIWIVSVW